MVSNLTKQITAAKMRDIIFNSLELDKFEKAKELTEEEIEETRIASKSW